VGFENAIYIALGSIIGQAFKLSDKGPLGKEQQWKQSVYSAALSQTLAGLSNTEHSLKPGLAYLAGLLHNIGIMILAQLFRAEYFWLNKTLAQDPDIQIKVLEKKQFGISHTELGSLMLLDWCLPLPITITVLEHHNLNYAGPYEEYVQLVQISNALLKSHDLSDAENDELPVELMENLGLEEEQVFMALDKLLEQSGELESMVQDMAS
jgi:HD-like signal output (HDOD) protein